MCTCLRVNSEKRNRRTQMAEADAKKSGSRVVLITGASSGIGRASALEFAKLGDKVAITGLEQAQLDLLLEELYEASPDARPLMADQFLAIQANFENEDEVHQVVPKVVAKFNRLDVLVNNVSGLGPSSNLFDETFFEDFQRILQVNLMSAVRLSQMAAPQLCSRQASDKAGVLINVSPVPDKLTFTGVGYCVSTAGVSMLTKTLANSLEGKNVRVLSIAPEHIATTNSIANDPRLIKDTQGSTRLFDRAGEVARLIVFLASDKASYMHGCTVDIDGGHLLQ